MSTQFLWGGVELGKHLGTIDEAWTEETVRKDSRQTNQLKKTYRILEELGVGKVNGKFVDTLAGLQEKMARAAQRAVARKSESVSHVNSA
jgi:hypothetical protein